MTHPNLNAPTATPCRMGLWLAIVLLVAVFGATGGAACSAVQTTPDRGPRGYLELQVEPSSAEVFIDEQYAGVVEGWGNQTIPVEPGVRRVELRAPGYYTQRFDLEIGAHELVTLELKMEPTFDDEPPSDDGDSPTQAPDAVPGAPEMRPPTPPLPGGERALVDE